MKLRFLAGAAVIACSAGAVMIAAPAVSQGASGPIARYTVDASTTSGLGAMGAGGGFGAAMGMLRGGGGQVAHELLLRLGSSRTATGAPKADHFVPQGTGLAPSVPLVTPERARSEPYTPGTMPQGQMPRGRLLLYWGCGEHAPKGQPVVIDFAKMAKGQVPPGLFAQGVNLPDDWEVLASNSTTYGEWPNARDSRSVPARSSLLGPHKVVSTYAPQIDFTLADDFMPALQPRSANLPSGAVRLDWNALPRATGYYAWLMGAKSGGGQDADMVWWSSSSTQQFGGALAGWLSPAAVAKLVSAGTVMPSTQISCTVPAEVKQAAGEVAMTQLYGYGPQADFAYPPRPANAKAAWKPDWIARVRFRSNSTIMLGMPGMDGMGQADGADSSSAPPPSGKPKCKKGLAGIAQRAAGLCE
ncbi:hypothetical protein [Tsuneonella deserti]|nr:hypothetical protein [Tsuneonella deserti]